MNVRPTYISTIDHTISSCNRLRSNARHHYWTTLRIQKKHKVLPVKWAWIEAPALKYAYLNRKTKKAQLGRLNLLLAKSDAFINAYTEYERLREWSVKHIKLVEDIKSYGGSCVSPKEFHIWKSVASIDAGVKLFIKTILNKDQTDYDIIGYWATTQWCIGKRREIWGKDPSLLEVPGTWLMCYPKENGVLIGKEIFYHNHNFL